MSRLGNLIVNVGANTKEFNKELGKVNRDIGRLTGNIQKMGKELSMAVTGPIALIAGTGIKTFMSFEAQMAKVQAVSGATNEEFKALSDNAKQLGSSTRFTASEVAQLQTEFAKLGFSAEEITKVTEATLALAQATDSDLATSAAVAGSTLRAFGMEASQTSTVTDVMAASFSSTALDMDSFSESMKHVAPVAAAAGIGIEETTAMLGVLANAGIKGSQAGTALRRIISDIGSTGGDVSKELANMAARGLDLADAKDEVGRNAQSALLVLSKGVPQMKQLTTEFGNSAGAAKAMADIMDNTTEGAMKRMQSAVEGAQLSIGSALAPALTKLMNNVASAAQAFSEMSAGGQRMIIVISGIAAAIGPVLIIVPQLVKGFMLIRVALLQSVIPAVMKLNAVLLANPYVLVAAGVAALTAAYFAFRRTSNEVYDVQSKIASAQQEAIKLASSEAVEVEKLSRKVEDTNLSQRQRIEALDELRRIAPDYFGDLDTETTLMDGLKNAVDEYRKSLVKAAEARVYQKMLDEAIEAQVQFQMEVKQMAKDLGITEDEARAVSGAMGAAMNDGADFARSNSQLIDELTGKLQELESEGYGGASSGVNALAAGSKQAFGGMISDAEEATKKLTDLEWAMHNLFQIDTRTDLDKKAQDVWMRGGTLEIEDIEMPEEDGFNVAELDFMKEKVDEYYANQEERMNNAIALSQQLGGAMSTMFGQIIDGSAGGAEAMKSMAMSVFKSLLNMAKAAAVASAAQSAAAKGPLAAYALPALTAASFGLVEGLLGAVAFADGGIVSGPTLGMVGEYSGARNNPEVIAPLDKLQNMIGGTGGSQEVTVHGKISGNDIELVRERGVDNLRRSRGGSRRS